MLINPHSVHSDMIDLITLCFSRIIHEKWIKTKIKSVCMPCCITSNEVKSFTLTASSSSWGLAQAVWFTDSNLLTRSSPCHQSYVPVPSTPVSPRWRFFLLASGVLEHAYFLLSSTPLSFLTWWASIINPFQVSKQRNRYIPKVIHNYSKTMLFQVGQIAGNSDRGITAMSRSVEMKNTHSREGTNRQSLQMEFGQWSEISIVKIDRTLFTNWSLKFQRGKQAAELHQFGTVL